MLREHGEKLPEDAKATTQERIDAVKTALENGELDTLRSSTDMLTQQIQTLGAQMYEQPEAAGGPAGGPDTEAGPDEDVVEGEVVE